MTTSQAAAAGESESTFTTAMEHIAKAFEALGALILIIGVLWSVALAVIAWRRTRDAGSAYIAVRQAFGGTLLLALEVLVAADLIPYRRRGTNARERPRTRPDRVDQDVPQLLTSHRDRRRATMAACDAHSGAGTVRRATQNALTQQPPS